VAIGVEPRVYALTSVPKTVPVRPQKFSGAIGDSAQSNAQAFIDTLPGDVRDKIGRLYRDPKKRDSFAQPERTEDDKPAAAKSEAGTGRQENVVQVDFPQPIFTQPILTPNAALLQVQFAANSTPASDVSLSQKEHEAFHAAYLNAGALRGGRAAALAAQIAQQELAKKTVIVSPVPTSVNLSA
jgi:hypothetical protein